MNRLLYEKSPYLLQHASNPVDWYPWGDEALLKALTNDMPIFLSIGYSTCHWCHVMERESFEDPEVAALLNDAFICVKVDREERPDLDEEYMSVCRHMTGGGGWPLTIVMTPERKPFFAATYIAKKGAFGRLGMLDLVPRLSGLWKTRRSELAASAEEVARDLGAPAGLAADAGTFNEETLSRAAGALERHFDAENGGFGGAPKFPMAAIYPFLLRCWMRGGDARLLAMVEDTLTTMRNGGIYDQLGFGFHRYSTDEGWRVPHFEKMLYDQALLALAYTEAWQATGKDFYRGTVREIFRYIQRDMTDPEGGFYTAEDADSEGEEGRFYLWRSAEIASVLSENERARFNLRYNVREEGNFSAPGGSSSGWNILHGGGRDVSAPGAAEEALRVARDQRARPFRDDKILSGWNGLMIAALARAGAAFGNPAYSAAASKAAAFIMKRMPAADGGLLHRWRDGEAAITAFADDYAYLAWGLLELYEATFDPSHLELARRLVDALLDRHWDPQEGGFFLTTEDAQSGFSRRWKPIEDGVVPSANSVAFLVLLKLAKFVEHEEYTEKARQILRLYSLKTVTESPASFCFFLSALDFMIGPSYEVVIAGDRAREDARLMISSLREKFIPNKVVLFRPVSGKPEITRLAPFTWYQGGINGKATAYVCRDFACGLPTNDAGVMLALLRGDSISPA
jgi:hypothetical protein